MSRNLAEIRGSLRQLRVLLDENRIDDAVFKQVESVLLERQTEITKRKRPAIPTTRKERSRQEPILSALPVEEEPVREAVRPPWRHLEDLLLEQTDPRQMIGDDRVRAVLWYRQSNEEQLASMHPRAMLALPKLLAIAQLQADTLHAYQRVIALHPAHELVDRAALDAAGYARDQGKYEDALWFLEWAIDHATTPELRDEAAKLLQSLPTEQPPEFLDALPVPSSVVEPARADMAATPVVMSHAEVAPPTEEPAVPLMPLKPSRPRRTWTEVLSGFMEQKNILWGELLGGLLIVGGSIALVISLWNTLAENPLYQFAIFSTVTVLLSAGGMYTLSHWKLESTSRGLLLIAALLVPLNFLVLAASGRDQPGLTTFLLEIAAIAVYGTMLRRTGGILVPQGPWYLVTAILGASVSQLLLPRLAPMNTGDIGWRLMLAAALPVGFHVGSMGVYRFLQVRRGMSGISELTSSYFLLGLSSFAVSVALGFVLYWGASRGPGISESLNFVAVFLGLAGMPMISLGLITQRELTDEPRQGMRRTFGTILALLGMAILAGALVLSWPNAQSVFAVGLVNFVLLAAISYHHRLPMVHVLGLPSLVAAYVTVFHLGDEALSWQSVAAPDRGLLLLPLYLVFAGAGALLARLHRGDQANSLAWGAVGTGLLSIALVTFPDRGAADPLLAMLVYGVTGLVGLLSNLRWRKPMAISLSWTVLALAVVWYFWFKQPREFALLAAVAAGEALVLAMIGALMQWRKREGSWLEAYADPTLRCAEALAYLAVSMGLYFGVRTLVWYGAHVVTAAGAACALTVLALLGNRLGTARISGLLFLGAAVAFSGWFMDQPIRDGRPERLSAFAGLVLGIMALVQAVLSAKLVRQGPGILVRAAEVLGAWRAPAVLSGILAMVGSGFAMQFIPSEMYTASACAVAAACLFLARSYNWSGFCWIGSLLLLVGIANGLGLGFDLAQNDLQQVGLALLIHASCLLSLTAMGNWLPRNEAVDRLYLVPLGTLALTVAFLTLPALLTIGMVPLPWLAGYLAWLAALWLVAAVIQHSRILFSGFQALLVLAVLIGTTSWLEEQTWFDKHNPAMLHDPLCLHAFGIGLTLLALAWISMRLGLMQWEEAQYYLEPGWPPLDRSMLGVLVIGQWLLVSLATAAVIARELSWNYSLPWWSPWDGSAVAHAWHGSSWLLLGGLVTALVAGLYSTRSAHALLGLLGLGVTVPLLLGGSGLELGTTRLLVPWLLASAFLILALAVWRRSWCIWSATKLRMSDSWPGPWLPTSILLNFTVLPILVIQLATAWQGFHGVDYSAPSSESIFATLPTTPVLQGPMLLAVLVLVGYCLREHVRAFALLGGVLIALTAALGRAVYVTQGQELSTAALRFGLAAEMIQYFALASAFWAMLWLSSRWSNVSGGTDRESAWLTAQLTLGGVANAVVVGSSVVWLLVPVIAPAPAQAWIAQAGSMLGWAALIACGTSFALRVPRTAMSTLDATVSTSQPALLALGPLILILLASCTVEWQWPGVGGRALMIGLGLFAAGLVGTLSFVLRRSAGTGDEFQARGISAGKHWTTGIAALLLPIAMHAAMAQGFQGSASVALLLVSLAGGGVAVWLRSAAWALSSCAGLFAATSFAVWYVHPDEIWIDWWPTLVQANVIVGAYVSFFWLMVRERGMYLVGLPGVDLDHRNRRWLAFQVSLGLLGLFILLAVPLIVLLLNPGLRLPASLQTASDPLAWIALILAVGAAGRYALAYAPDRFMHLPAILGSGIGALSAIALSPANPGTWHSLHVWGASWLAVSLVLLVGGRTLARSRSITSARWFHLPILRSWIVGLGLASALLAARGTFTDPLRPQWPASIVFGSSMALGLAALWFRSSRYVLLSGVLLNVAGTMCVVWQPTNLQTILYVNVLCLGIGAAVWTVVRLAVRDHHYLDQPAEATPLSRWMWHYLVEVRGSLGCMRVFLFGAMCFLSVVLAFATILLSRVLNKSDDVLFVVLWLVLFAGMYFTLGRWLVHSVLSSLSNTTPAFAHMAGRLALIVLAVLVTNNLATTLTKPLLFEVQALSLPAWVAVTIAMALMLWDRRTTFALRGLYALGLIAIAMGLYHAQFAPLEGQDIQVPRSFLCHATLALAAYVLATSALYWIGNQWPRFSASLRLPQPVDYRLDEWLVHVQLTALFVLALGAWLAMGGRFSGLQEATTLADRLGGPLATLLMVPAGMLLFNGRQPPRTDMQFGTLFLGVVASAQFGWALLDPRDHGLEWLALHRMIVVMVALAFTGILYGTVFPRVLPSESGWSRLSGRIGPWLAGGAAALILVILVQEAILFDGHRVVQATLGRMFHISAWNVEAMPPDESMSSLAVLAVAAAILGLLLAFLRFALVTNADPLGLSEQRRQAYVYGAEVLAVLFFLHIRIVRPEYFGGWFFRQYWPFVVTAVAFLACGLGELFKRRRIHVLAQPLETTGVWLPLLPLIVFWAIPPERYASLWFLVAGLYALQAISRHSQLFGFLAALCANVGLWVLLSQTQFQFLTNPQMWLIPLALIILVAEHVNRDRLTRNQAVTLRYVALLVVYVSSTADMFLTGLGQSFVYPLVLAVLCVLGVLAGMLLRVQSFLILGVSFLLLDLAGMIWHAGVDREQTWILWTSVIALGVTILVLFGFFEKRRNDVLALVEKFKTWD